MYGANTGRIAAPSGKGFIAYDAMTGYPVSSLSQLLPLVANDAAGQIANWTNPFPFPVLIESANLVVLTASTGACTVSTGIAANAQTSSSNMAASTNVNATLVGNLAAGITLASRVVNPGEAVTVSRATGASAGLVGWFDLRLKPLGIVRNS